MSINDRQHDSNTKHSHWIQGFQHSRYSAPSSWWHLDKSSDFKIGHISYLTTLRVDITAARNYLSLIAVKFVAELS